MNEFEMYMNLLTNDQMVQQMKQYIQHGKVTTYDHCFAVAKNSYRFSNALHLNCNNKELIRGAMLHDFYLYDWHDSSRGERLHGFKHPGIAANKAKEHFNVTNKEYNIIRNHMWPLTLFHMPKSKEEAIVCAVDKYVSIKETLFYRK